MLLATNRIPRAAKEGSYWYNNPEILGLKAYKLEDWEQEEG